MNTARRSGNQNYLTTDAHGWTRIRKGHRKHALSDPCPSVVKNLRRIARCWEIALQRTKPKTASRHLCVSVPLWFLARRQPRIVPAFQASGFSGTVTWASARQTRSSPGCHMAGLQPCRGSRLRENQARFFRRGFASWRPWRPLREASRQGRDGRKEQTAQRSRNQTPINHGFRG